MIRLMDPTGHQIPFYFAKGNGGPSGPTLPKGSIRVLWDKHHKPVTLEKKQVF
jgi:hypothetical protein